MKNNVRGSIIILEAAAIMIVAALVMRIKAGADELPPVISIPEGIVSYTQGDDPEVLLSGVTAFDEKDGDVTDSILISSITVKGNGGATAIYHAKDNSNNVAVAERSIQFTPDETAGLAGLPVNSEPLEITILPGEDENGQSVHDESVTPEDSSAADDGTGAGESTDSYDSTVAGSDDSTASDGVEGQNDAAGTQSAQSESADSVLLAYEDMEPDNYTGDDMEIIGSALRSETEAAKENLPDGSPSIGLMAHAIFQDVGSSLNPLDIISSIDDAEDPIEYIFGQIHVEGNAGFTTEYPGKYLFRYYVIDSDGNKSNVARLYVVVR